MCVLASSFGSPKSQLLILAIGSVAEVCMTVGLGLSLQVSVAEESLGREQSGVGSGLGAGQRGVRGDCFRVCWFWFRV